MKNSISPSELWGSVSARWCLPDRVLDELCREAAFLGPFRTHVGTWTAFTLRTHTLKVMDCYEQNFVPRLVLDARPRALFRLFLALHDIGKPAAIEAGDKRWQHRFTVTMMRQAREFFAVTDREFEDWIALVDGDPIGSYLKREMSLSAAAELVQNMQNRSSLDRQAFWKSLITYYQCDASSYTTRAGLMSALDGLFDWNADKSEILFDEYSGCLKFSEPVRAALSALRTALNLKD